MKTDNFRMQYDKADQGALSAMNPYKPLNNTVKGTAALAKYQISSSANVYTLVVIQSHCLTADQATGTLMFTHRADPNAGLGNSSADIVTSFSTDEGVSWTQNIVLQNSENNRYPSGVIYNPVGTANIDSTMAVWCGPVWHGPSGNEVWDQNFFGCSTFSGLVLDTAYFTNPISEEVMIRMGFSACDDGFVHVMGPNYDYNSTTGYMNYRNTVVMNGVFNPGTLEFDWTEVVVPADDFVNDATDGDLVGSYNMQWSQDGNMGWIYYTGRDNRNDQYAYQPIAYYSTDKGNTWTAKPWFDYGSIPAIDTNFWPTSPDHTTVVPTFFYWNDGVVDANGELHIFLNGNGKYSVHPDSLTYSYVYQPDFVIDLFTTPTGWDAVLIDTLWSEQVPSDQSGYGTGDDAVGWTHRTQASRSYDGTKVFVVWTDTDTLFSEMNKFPDVIGWGMDVNTLAQTDVVNFTKGTVYAANNFFQYVSNITLKDGSTYTIPVSTAELGATPDQPVGHYYLSGVELQWPCGVDAMFNVSPATLYTDSTVTFTDASTGNPNTWMWKFGDGGTSTVQNPTHIYTAAGTYTVKLTAGDGLCDDTYELDVVVENFIGIKEHDANIAVDIYPNPTKDVLNISSPETIKSVKIFNAFGRLVADEVVGYNMVKINTSEFTPGMYFIQIDTEAGYVTRKINVVE
jgi:hypothetical protein